MCVMLLVFLKHVTYTKIGGQGGFWRRLHTSAKVKIVFEMMSSRVNPVSAIPRSIEIRVYDQVINLRGSWGERLSRAANDIFASMQDGSLSILTTLPVNTTILEFLNIRYTEKQVKRIDENFSDYYLGNAIAQFSPSFKLKRKLKYLKEKYVAYTSSKTRMGYSLTFIAAISS